MSCIVLPFTNCQFVTVLADPPWPEQGGGKIKRGADRHYPLMKVSEIVAMGAEVHRITADNSHLWLWTTNTYLHDALHVMDAWGYEYKSVVCWKKNRIGLGQYLRGITEHCLFGVRGMVPYKVRADGKRAQGVTHVEVPIQGYIPAAPSVLAREARDRESGILTPQDWRDAPEALPNYIEAPKQEHSHKPDRLREMVETVSTPPYLEMFARYTQPRDGWSYWGNEAEVVT